MIYFAPKKFEKFMLSQAAVLIRENKCLILEYEGTGRKWGLPGGRVDVGEGSWEEAFRREIKEEIALSNFEILGIADHDFWKITKDGITVKKGEHISAVVRLIKNDDDKVKLSNEHTQLKWIRENEINDYDFLWPRADKMIREGFAYKKLLDQKNANQ